jgi:hypothetical protein
MHDDDQQSRFLEAPLVRQEAETDGELKNALETPSEAVNTPRSFQTVYPLTSLTIQSLYSMYVL